MAAVGRSVRLFLVDGNPSGLITAEIMNWTGHILVVPRSRLADAITREEAGRTGVYFLFGDDPDQALMSRLYIGEADSVADRIKQHARDESKEFWSSACLITSKDQNLTKAHVRYLESRLIELAKASGRASLANNTAPLAKPLPESDIADMEFFIEQVQVILPVLGFDFLKLRPTRIASQEQRDFENSVPTIELELNHRSGLHAEAVLAGEELTVFQGSTAATEEFVTNTYASLRRSLIEEGKLRAKADSEFLEFVADVPFRSPSAASSVILNRNSNGRTAWKIKNSGLSLKDWEDARLEAVPDESIE